LLNSGKAEGWPFWQNPEKHPDPVCRGRQKTPIRKPVIKGRVLLANASRTLI
jgi:hypothetical protein